MKEKIMKNPNQRDLSRRSFIGKAGAATAVFAFASNELLRAKYTPMSIDGLNANLQQPSDIVSPEILPDRRAILRLFAPNAKSVTIHGDHPIGDKYLGAAGQMNKDNNGVWSVTIGPLAPEFYGYYYMVDGMKTLDLNNIFINRDGINYLNVLRIPGPELSDYEINDVPHGNMSIVWYPSSSLGANRRTYVYTPPGYETSNMRFPVLYLLHGGSGDEDAWTTLGHAPYILDNLIAEGKAKPMIVVMPNGNSTRIATPDLMTADSHPKTNVSDQPRVRTNFPKSLVKDLIPFIDNTYRTKNEKEHRAIAGLSVGGAQTMYAAFNNPELFNYVAAFSGGFPAFPEWAINIEPPANADRLRGPDISKSIDPEKYLQNHPKLNADANSQLQLLYISMGMDDGLITNHRDMKNMLDRQEVKYTLFEREGYGHEWSFWRLSLHDLLPRLF